MKFAGVVVIGCALLFSLAAPGLRCSSLEVSAVQPTSPFHEDGHFLEWEHGRIYYVDRGQGGVPIVLVHGFGASLYTWRHMIEPLSREYRVIALDLPGYGFSDKPDIQYNMALFSAQILHLLDALGVQRAVFVGNSMGGKITLFTALHNPERVESMVLIDAAAYVSGSSGRPFILRLVATPCVGEVLTSLSRRSRVRDILEDVYHDDSKITEADVDAYHAPMLMEGGNRAALSLLRSDAFGGDIEAGVPSIRIPALIIWGQEDTWIPVANGERLHRELPDSRLEVLPATGHVPQEEAPELVLPLVQRFLH
jgi:pimeloyl-ACP methyl ester carboxylesterase